MPDYSETFYRTHARRYSEASHQHLHSVYVKSSHPLLKGDTNLHDRLKILAPGKRGLDAGCGAGGRDVYTFYQDGYDMLGVDAVEENIALARELHPEIRDRVQVHNLRQPLPFPDADFDFVMCNAVIQHIDREVVLKRVLPELVRVLRPNGVLQLMFKNGEGIITVHDDLYNTSRTFLLYEEDTILHTLTQAGMRLIPAEDGQLGGIMHFSDPKPVEHCVIFMRKRQSS